MVGNLKDIIPIFTDIGEHLGVLVSITRRIDASLDDINSKMPFEERELAAEKAENDNLLRELENICSNRSMVDSTKVSQIHTLLKNRGIIRG
jgi:hypothetical protein